MRADTALRLLVISGRIVVAALPLGIGVTLLAALIPHDAAPSAPGTLLARGAGGAAIALLTFAVIAILRRGDRMTTAEAGLGGRGGIRLALWGALLWLAPAAVAFGVLAGLGAPLTVTAPPEDVVRTVLLLTPAVLLLEALPEEAAFRGYIGGLIGREIPRWWAIVVQALLFTLFAAGLRGGASPVDLSLFLTMGIGLGYLRMITGSIWVGVGFHTAFQTGSQLVLSHDVVAFAGGEVAAMLALGAVPFTVAGVAVSVVGIPRFVRRTPATRS